MNTPLKPKHGQKTNRKPKANKPVVKKQQTKQPPTHKVQGEEVAAVKSGLHPRNRHRGQYDFPALIKVVPELQSHVMKNPKGQWTINFADPISVKLLNKALLVCITVSPIGISQRAFYARPFRVVRITFIAWPIYCLKAIPN